MDTREFTLEAISELTGFDHGDRFASEQEVREYFTVAEMRLMFGDDWGETGLDQDALDEMAQRVIDNGWHSEDCGSERVID